MSDLTFAKLMEIRRMALDSEPRYDSIFASANLAAKVADTAAYIENPLIPRTRLCGLEYHQIPGPAARQPVLQISPGFEHCSPEFRAAWNAWALERFGTEEVCYLVNSRALAAVMQGRIDEQIARAISGGIVRLRNCT